MDKEKADAYFREKNRNTVIYLIIWFFASYFVVLFAEVFATFTFNSFPFHYFMGAQGAVVIFIILLFVNAVRSDRLDRKYGLTSDSEQSISDGKPLDQ